MSDKSIVLIWIIGGIAVIAITAIIGATTYRTTVSNNKRDPAIVEACVANGGSWIIDGTAGECWQKGQFQW